MDAEKIKAALGKQASLMIKDDMYVGLGTGSTVHYFIKELGQRCKSELKNICAVASSVASEELARSVGIHLLDSVPAHPIDITVDGADVIREDKALIKGGGGALLREKILATHAKEFIVLADESKLEKQWYDTPWPIEIIPFASALTISAIHQLGLQGTLRQNTDAHQFFITDNGNYIYDVTHMPKDLDYAQMHAELLHIAGVVETGFFPPSKCKILVGRRDLTTYEIP